MELSSPKTALVFVATPLAKTHFKLTGYVLDTKCRALGVRSQVSEARR